MSFKKEVESTGIKPQHEWQRTWGKADWEKHEWELEEMDKAIQECATSDDFQAKFGAVEFRDYCGAHCKCFMRGPNVEYKDAKHSTPVVVDPYQYQINSWKLKKLKMWNYAKQEKLKELHKDDE